ncbi:MAG: hypothetical protein NTV87_11000 [Ignavibacteriae bacterium]|jgi:hypothetical protein|nr:hypothetical protein [Ignavibacteriota bacterium]
MKKQIFLSVLVVLFSVSAGFSQFKQPDYTKKTNRTTNNLILGIFNPKNFSMNHSFQVSMLSSRYGNISVTSYVNSMAYRFSDKLNISADVKLQYSPYASSSFGKEYSNGLQNDLNGLTLSRLSLDYKISDNSALRFEFRKFDESDYYNGYGNPYYNNFYNGFFR